MYNKNLCILNAPSLHGLVQPSYHHASLSNAPSENDPTIFFLPPSHAWTIVHISFFSRYFSPLTRMRGTYCRTNLLHCKTWKMSTDVTLTCCKWMLTEEAECLLCDCDIFCLKEEPNSLPAAHGLQTCCIPWGEVELSQTTDITWKILGLDMVKVRAKATTQVKQRNYLSIRIFQFGLDFIH